MRKGEYDKGMADYSEAIRLDLFKSARYEDRGDVYSENGEYDKAMADYSESIRLQPDSEWWAYYKRGNLYDKKGDYDKAIADYTEALRPVLRIAGTYPYVDYEVIRWYPPASDIYQTLARINIEKKDFTRAVFDLEKALEFFPKNKEDIKKKLEEARKALREK